MRSSPSGQCGAHHYALATGGARNAASGGSLSEPAAVCTIAGAGLPTCPRRERTRCQRYLKRHELTKRNDVNTIANRTLISNETNAKIKDKASADYLNDPDILPVGVRGSLLGPHPIGEATCAIALSAREDLFNSDAADVYPRFLQVREEEIIQEIRRVRGVAHVQGDMDEDAVPDDVAADVKAGNGTSDDEDLVEMEFDVA